MLRNIGGVIAGIVAGLIVMFIVAFIGGQVFPTPIRVDATNAQEIVAAFASVPLGAKLFVLLSWFAAAFAGGALAKFITGERWAAWTVALIFTVYALANVFVLPMETWMQIVAVIAPVIGGWLASHVKAARRDRDEVVDDETTADAEI